MNLEGTQWVAIFAFALGFASLLAGLYITPRKDDEMAAMRLYLLRAEGPALMIVGLGLYLYPIDWMIFASIPILMVGSVIGLWLAYRWQAEQKNRSDR